MIDSIRSYNLRAHPTTNKVEAIDNRLNSSRLRFRCCGIFGISGGFVPGLIEPFPRMYPKDGSINRNYRLSIIDYRL